MFNPTDALETIKQAEQMHKQLHDRVLEQELAILKEELDELPKCHDVMKEVQELTCEYYAHQLKNTLTVLLDRQEDSHGRPIQH